MTSTSKRKAVITGIGIVSPIGIGVDHFWESLLANKSGIDRIKSFDPSSFPSQIAGEVKDFDPSIFLNKKQVKFHSKAIHFSCAAYKMALMDSNLEDFDPYRTDVIIGASIPSLDVIDDELDKSDTSLKTYAPGQFDPFFSIRFFTNGPTSSVALMANAKGYITTISSACSSGITAIGTAAQRIMDGYTDVSITGAIDTPVNRVMLNAFCAANLISTDNEHPTDAIRPFDAKRTHPALAEGSAIFIIESEEHAIARRANVYAEVASYYQDHENTNEIFSNDKSGESWSRNLKKALELAGIKNHPDHINAHAPSDMAIDKIECNAIKLAFGEAGKSIPTTSIKGALGSAFSAAGGFQVAAAAKTISDQTLPPSHNFEFPDNECDLNIVTKPTKVKKINSVMVQSHALGSTNSTLVLKKY